MKLVEIKHPWKIDELRPLIWKLANKNEVDKFKNIFGKTTQ